MANTTGKKFGGRKKGSVNKVTADVRTTIASIVNNNISTMEQDLKDLEPYQRIKVILDLIQFIAPKIKSVEHLTIVEPNEPMTDEETKQILRCLDEEYGFSHTAATPSEYKITANKKK